MGPYSLLIIGLLTHNESHYQAAQPISVGRRAAQWVQDLVMDLDDIEYIRAILRFRGAQGTTGTQVNVTTPHHIEKLKLGTGIVRGNFPRRHLQD